MPRASVIFLLIIIVHLAGRVCAICHPFKVDSYTYSIAAYKLWNRGATVADLVADKPPGQAMLTGWMYRVIPGEPTRLTLVPLESAFLLGAYAVFFLIARYLHGSRVAWVLTMFFVLAHNIYNSLDFTTDGFNLNENYMALPMLAAVLAYLKLSRPFRRNILVGFFVGVALLIKQSAIGLVLALVVAEIVGGLFPSSPRLGKREDVSRRLVAVGSVFAIGVGVVLAFAPVAGYLWGKGWLGVHLEGLFNRTSSHAALPPWTWPRWYNISPLVPAFWMIALAVATRRGHSPQAAGENDSGEAIVSRASRCATVLLTVWLVVELATLVAMRKPATHYYQQIVAPLVLLSGFGLSMFCQRVSRLRDSARVKVWRWAGGTTLVWLILAAMPLFSSASSRIGTMNYRDEVHNFAARMNTPTAPIPLEQDGRGK